MVRCLLWNLRGNQASTWPVRAANLRQCLARLARSLDLDLFLLVESGFTPAELVADLETSASLVYAAVPGRAGSIQHYHRLPPAAVVTQFADAVDGRSSAWTVTVARTELLLVGVHFQSPLYWTVTDQALQATVLAQDIAEWERRIGHRRTIVAGDFNMDPFHPGLAGAQGLQAVMDREVARSERRTVAGRDYFFFYNALWGCFGDRTPGPSGTYFYPGSTPVAYYWHLFDQVLVRPDLMDALLDLRVLDHDGEEALVTASGRPRAIDLTDHLPVYFRLNMNGGHGTI